MSIEPNDSNTVISPGKGRSAIPHHIGGREVGKDSYKKDYFSYRVGNDPQRVACFRQEADYVKSIINNGRLMDIGCGTGEFIEYLQWNGSCYGMEVSEFAISEARLRGVLFDTTIFDVDNFFDVVIFRGTIQHIDTPFLYLKRCRAALRPGGFIIFLATPNANSIYYRLWNTLPCLDNPRNFYIPSDVTLTNALRNFGFEIVDISFPYLTSPYASPLHDHWKFLLKLFGIQTKFPFWRNMMHIIARNTAQK